MLAAGTAALGGTAVTMAGGNAGAETETGTQALGATTVRPGDPQYADLISGYNQRFIGRPEYVRVVGSASQVVQAVNEAVRAGKRVAVRSGGYCFENFVADPAVQVVIDMSTMKAISFDPLRRAVMVEAGALIADVYKVLFTRWGVVIPAGICQNVGVGGHIAGGAYGALNRLHGLAVDHLHAVEVVVVDGNGRARVVFASREENEDLWWAHTGGGGGNFGVVTRYWFRTPGAGGGDPRGLLPRPPSEVLLHTQSWPWASMTEAGFARLVANAGAFYEANSAPDSPYNSLFSHLRLTQKVQGAIGFAAQIDATRPDAEKLMADFVGALGEGVGVAATPGQHRTAPWVHSVWWNGFAGTNPTERAKFKSAYLRKSFTGDHVAAIYRNAVRTDNTAPMVVQIASYGGKVNTVAPTATAVPQRDSVMKVMWATSWQNPADDARYLGLLREGYRATFAGTGGVPVHNDVTDGCFVNYADADLSDPALNTSDQPWHQLYYGANYARLQQVKDRWDPRGVFRHAQSVEPA